METHHNVGLHCCVYPAPHIHATPDPCSTDSSGPTSQATCSTAPKCGSLGPPQRGGQPRRTNVGGWSTQPRRSHVCHSPMLCIPSAETAPDPCSMDHDTHNLTKQQVDTHHHVGLHCCVYPAPHIHAAPDPCSTDSSGPTSQATCSTAPKCGSLGPPQRGGQPRHTNVGGWSTQPRRSHVCHSPMLCLPSAETAPDSCSMDHDTHNLTKQQVDTHHHVGLHCCVYPAPHIHAAPDPCSTDSSGPTSQATCSAAPKCGSLGPPQRGGQPRHTNVGGWSTQPRRSHVCHSPMLCIPSAETAPDPCSMDHDTHNLTKQQVDTHHHVGLHCCVYPAPHIHATPDPCSTDSSGPTSQATCSAALKCGSLGPPQRGGQPRHTNVGGWSTQPRRSHVCHSPMLCIPSAETAPDPCSMDHDTHNLTKKQVDTHHHVGLHCCVYPAPHIRAAPDPCSMDPSGPTSQATCSTAPKCGSLGPPQRGGQPRRTNVGGWSTQPRRSHVCHSPMLCIPSTETAPDPCSMDHDTHNLTKQQVDTHHHVGLHCCVYPAPHIHATPDPCSTDSSGPTSQATCRAVPKCGRLAPQAAMRYVIRRLAH